MSLFTILAVYAVAVAVCLTAFVRHILNYAKTADTKVQL